MEGLERALGRELVAYSLEEGFLRLYFDLGGR